MGWLRLWVEQRKNNCLIRRFRSSDDCLRLCATLATGERHTSTTHFCKPQCVGKFFIHFLSRCGFFCPGVLRGCSKINHTWSETNKNIAPYLVPSNQRCLSSEIRHHEPYHASCSSHLVYCGRGLCYTIRLLYPLHDYFIFAHGSRSGPFVHLPARYREW